MGKELLLLALLNSELALPVQGVVLVGGKFISLVDEKLEVLDKERVGGQIKAGEVTVHAVLLGEVHEKGVNQAGVVDSDGDLLEDCARAKHGAAHPEAPANHRTRNAPPINRKRTRKRRSTTFVTFACHEG